MVVLNYVIPYQKRIAHSSYELFFIYIKLLLCYSSHIEIAYIGNLVKLLPSFPKEVFIFL